ncbi:FMN-dependent NADH-azoreductase [Flavobacterium noncentrifugens]|uniref:FMN dependent NADH:quinone oxidoreductase n=1 Tax=Flavobacterium noncentrifugens TaxID=1128970 RepID=A0A1G8YZ18_9FLAO|nr:NAD(P)H-dependent oxidoreductase [Flavobacterium noncentrifugens]GEP51390.1 FMN-dependent NADH-azoreductase [Flavobacterium noncentrifugens]SDK07315.1 FMN-dependent NADH-azoreductase [Flavobacterium noncentrifugens]
MKNILHIISSPRGDASFSIKLGNAIIEKIETANPGSIVRTTNLNDSILPHLSASHLASFFTPEDQQTSDNKETARASEEAIADLKWADVIVVGVPVYNFGIPSALKAWVDHIARAGKTFNYSASGAEGLLKNKKVYVALASGAVFSEGPMQAYDFASPYLKSVLGFLGITDVETYRVEGTAIPDLAENALEKGIDSITV